MYNVLSKEINKGFTFRTDLFRYHGFRKLFLVDTENTMNLNFLLHFDVSKNDYIVLFETQFSKNPSNATKYILDFYKDNLIVIPCVRHGKNSLDIQLLMYLSSLVGKFNDERISVFVVSDDNDFEVFGHRLFNFIKCPSLLFCKIGSCSSISRGFYEHQDAGNGIFDSVEGFISKGIDVKLNTTYHLREDFLNNYTKKLFSLNDSDEGLNCLTEFLEGNLLNMSKHCTQVSE